MDGKPGDVRIVQVQCEWISILMAVWTQPGNKW